jgi:aldose 1-epimerase
MALIKKTFGVLSTGEEVALYSLKSGVFEACISNYGATWLSFLVPSKLGAASRDDLLLGFSELGGYMHNTPFFGATIGRYANRIAGASFTLSGRRYALTANDGTNHLHGGKRGFDKQLWQEKSLGNNDEPTLLLGLTSPDGDEGYPGTLEVQARFSLEDRGIDIKSGKRTAKFSIEYSARCDAPTPLCMTNHAYFNLAGEGSGGILDHEVELLCDEYLPCGGDHIPLKVGPQKVEGTPFDFSSFKAIGKEIQNVEGGYDHCYVKRKGWGEEAPFVFVRDPKTDRSLAVATSLPSVQFYTGNMITSEHGKRGATYGEHAGFCIEPEFYPDSPNRPDFPSCILEPGQTRKDMITYLFTI